jgi:acetyltransferase-like isoleucine patch superfamily enzyme
MSLPLLIMKSGYRACESTMRWWSTRVGRVRLRWIGRARLGRNVRVAGPVRVKVSFGGRLVIGDDVRLVCGFRYNPVGHDSMNAFWVGPGATLDIGAGAGLSSTTIVARQGVHIGERTYIGGGAKIYDNDFHSLDPRQRLAPVDNDVRTRAVHIGAECFIGGYSIILKGVSIGDRAVVGAGSVVARDIPADQIWAGNPAVFVRDLFPKRDGSA